MKEEYDFSDSIRGKFYREDMKFNLPMNEKTRVSICNLLTKEIPTLQAIYLFGSYANDTATEKSDVDIAYLTTKPLNNVRRWEISQELASLLSRDVDLIELSQTNTIFRYQILSNGTRIYGEGYTVESFETLAYSFYLRFKEERKPIVDAICEDRKLLGDIVTMNRWNLKTNQLECMSCL